jgi:hypothetical protein
MTFIPEDIIICSIPWPFSQRIQSSAPFHDISPRGYHHLLHSMTFLPEHIIICSIHTVWHTACLNSLKMGFGETSLQAVLFHCPHSTHVGVMFPVDVSTVPHTATIAHTSDIVSTWFNCHIRNM